jgi:para-nitrobenzyl esterase
MQFNNGATLVPVPNQENIAFFERFFDWIRSQRTIKP